jgi:aminoglycoside phosphotransferase (APT) family kinase protein
VRQDGEQYSLRGGTGRLSVRDLRPQRLAAPLMIVDLPFRTARTRAERVLDVVRAALPGLQVHSVVFLGQGLDNLVYEVNGELIVRFSKEPDPMRRAKLISSEVELLAAVADISPLPVPEPVFADRGHGCWTHAKLPGVPLLDLPLPQRLAHAPATAAELGRFLAALHAAPARKMAQLCGRAGAPQPTVRARRQGPGGIFSSRRWLRRRQRNGTATRKPPDRRQQVEYPRAAQRCLHVIFISTTSAILSRRLPSKGVRPFRGRRGRYLATH